jgi:hypothetical protein
MDRDIRSTAKTYFRGKIMRLKTLSTLLLGGVLAVTLVGCTGGTEPKPNEQAALEGQISLSDTLKVSYESATVAPEADIVKLKELNPEVGAFDQGYIPIYLRMSIATTDSKEDVLQAVNENVFAIASDSAQVGALPVTAGTDCDGSVLTAIDGTDNLSYCKVVLLEPEKDPALVGISSFDSKEIFNTPVGFGTTDETPTPEPTN